MFGCDLNELLAAQNICVRAERTQKSTGISEKLRDVINPILFRLSKMALNANTQLKITTNRKVQAGVSENNMKNTEMRRAVNESKRRAEQAKVTASDCVKFWKNRDLWIEWCDSWITISIAISFHCNSCPLIQNPHNYQITILSMQTTVILAETMRDLESVKNELNEKEKTIERLEERNSRIKT